MKIDLDKSKKSNTPPWDLTVTHQGRIYAVREPSASELMEIPVLLKKNPFAACSELSALFYRLTGIEQGNHAHLTLDQLSMFLRGLIEYVTFRAKTSEVKVPNAAIVQATHSAMKLN